MVEDDTQNGLDHVDGYRSIFLAIGPWVKREYVSKTHTSLASVFKTVNLILGLPPLNQYDAAATDLRDMFTAIPNLSPYHFQTIPYAKAAKRSWERLTREHRLLGDGLRGGGHAAGHPAERGAAPEGPGGVQPAQGSEARPAAGWTPTPPAGSSLRQAGAGAVQANAAP